MELQGKRGAGAFQWNRGGWFGSQIGATVWLILLGAMLLFQSEPVGALVVVFGLIPNLIGYVLWRRRRTLSPYPAIQLLLASCGVSALFAMISVWAVSITTQSVTLPGSWFLLMYPGLMVAFHLQERAVRKSSA